MDRDHQQTDLNPGGHPAARYKAAGVDIEAGYESVRRIKQHVARTRTPGALPSLGAFGAMFHLGALHYDDPVLVSGTDGVGTKIFFAFLLDRHDTIGIDAVAMCVNDIIVQGTKPLFFLDYVALGQSRPDQVEAIVKGIADGCVQAGAALIGGETAEMSDLYSAGHYDIAGFAVGVAERQALIDGSRLRPGDVLIGLPSSGIHSNGYSLVRQIVLKDHPQDLDALLPEYGRSWGEVLLTPTRIYVQSVLALMDQVDIHGMAHITGGGFYENIPRMGDSALGYRIDVEAIPRPPIFDRLARLGGIDESEMYHVFNMGLGFLIAVDAADVDRSLAMLRAAGEAPFVAGLVTDSGAVDLG